MYFHQLEAVQQVYLFHISVVVLLDEFLIRTSKRVKLMVIKERLLSNETH